MTWCLLQVGTVADDDNNDNDKGLYFLCKFVPSLLEDTFPLTGKEEETIQTKGNTGHSQQLLLQLPMHWSKATKSWIQQVVGAILEPEWFGSHHRSYADECQHGILMMVMRSTNNWNHP